MNIFIIMLMSLFMVGYYMFFAPNARMPEQETDTAIAMSDLRSVAECALAVHNAQISGNTFDDVCVSQNDIKSKSVCLDNRGEITGCGVGKRSNGSFIITTTGAINVNDYNAMMEILEQSFATSGTFGIYQDGVVIAGGTSAKRVIPESVKKEFDLKDGQLVYITHYDIPDPERVFTGAVADDINCPVGTTKTYRFGRWQCIGYNMKTSCGGDTVWDYGTMECVPDESRRPLCSGNQTAVMVDGLWECLSPFGERTCPPGMIARLNYDILEWECVEDLNQVKQPSKCAVQNKRAIRGRDGATLRLSSALCNDCEKAIIDEENCNAICVPDPTKISSPLCYPGRTAECSGSSRAFYFGFPTKEYVANVEDISVTSVPFDSSHSQNRRFNCLDCGNGTIDTSRSLPPYIAVCNE
ncbi:MAG: hypothetical protein J6T57_00410 [Alphaproteobacteria bacterium]|nr:hypothetical protein [Alphaproteobacteria bacterium]